MVSLYQFAGRSQNRYPIGFELADRTRQVGAPFTCDSAVLVASYGSGASTSRIKSPCSSKTDVSAVERLAVDPLAHTFLIQVRGDAPAVEGPARTQDHAQIDVLG